MPRPSVPLLLASLAVLAGVVFLVAHLVVTDEEAIENLVERAEEAVVSEDFDGFLDLLTEDFQRRGQDRDRAVAWLEDEWSALKPTGLRTEVLEVEVAGDGAEGRVQVDVFLAARAWRLLLEVDFVRTPEGWRFAAAAEEGRRRRP